MFGTVSDYCVDSTGLCGLAQVVKTERYSASVPRKFGSPANQLEALKGKLTWEDLLHRRTQHGRLRVPATDARGYQDHGSRKQASDYHLND